LRGRVLLAGLLAAIAMLPAAGSAAALRVEDDPARRQQLDALLADLEATPAAGRVAGGQGARRALIVGNDTYETLDPLQKAIGDAESLAGELTQLDFVVSLHKNVGLDDFDTALEDFYGTIAEGDTALLFYSGHGIAFEGVNYLLPVDTPELAPDEGRKLKRVAVNATEILESVKERGVELAMVVLDACRDDPFAREGTRGGTALAGLAPVEPERGVFVIYSAGVGEKALDRLGPDDPEPNSVFTRKFLPILATPGLPLVDIAKRTQVEVRELAKQAKHVQAPAYYDQVVGQYYFQPPRPRLFGIAIGVDEYVGYNLRGAVNDAERVARAVEALGADKVVRLFDRNANVQFIDYVWRDMIEDARPGDTIVLHYAGASVQIPDASGDEEDGRDEVLTLSGVDFPAAAADLRTVDPGAVILDDALTSWMELAAAKNINVVFIADGCHGGGLLDREFANVSFVGASAEDETVLEYEIGGRMHGAASVAFAEAVEGAADYNSDGYVSQRELFRHLASFVLDVAGSQQTPNFLPLLLGEGEARDRATDLPLFQVPADIEDRKAALDLPWPGDQSTR
jgi:hypothetical protein